MTTQPSQPAAGGTGRGTATDVLTQTSNQLHRMNMSHYIRKNDSSKRVTILQALFDFE